MSNGFPQTGYACDDCSTVIEVVGFEVEGPLCPNCGDMMRWNHESGEFYY